MSSIEPTIRVLKAAKCPSLSGRSVLTYNVGCDANANVFLRVLDNSGGGMFNKDWVAYASVEAILKARSTINALSMGELFKGKSVNTAGFLMSVLKDLGLIKPAQDDTRIYESTPTQALLDEVDTLIKSGVALSPAEASNPSQPGKRGTLRLKASTTKAATSGVAVRE